MHNRDSIRSQLEDVAQLGSFFIYDLDWLKKHAEKLSSANPSKLFYACKANPLRYILEIINNAKIRFDVASAGELKQVLDLGISGKDIIMTGPAKPESLLRFGLDNKIGTYVIESVHQLRLLERLSSEYKQYPNVLLRLQLKWNEDDNSVLGGNNITPFGVDLKTAEELLNNIKLPLLGFHVFQWGNILSAKKLKDIWSHTIKVCKELKSDFKVIDVGGGLGIPYQGQKELEWEEITKSISDLKKFHQIQEFWLELGRYMTGSCGFYITSVVDKKVTYDKNILVLAGGINHLARPALVQESFPAELLRKSDGDKIPFRLHGPLCTSLDYFGQHLLPSDVKIGDVIIFKQVGAYGFTESMPYFLCHNLPGEAVIRDGKLDIVRKVSSPLSWL